MLAGRVRDLAAHLLPAGVQHGHEWRCGGVDGSRGESLAVHIGGQKAGVWADFATGETGDALDLVAAVLYRGDRKGAYAWALRWLGLTDAAAPATRAAVVPAQAAPAAAPTDFRKAALALFLAAQPGLAGTPAAAYLAARGIDLARLGRQPRALRFHPRCWCSETQMHLPALVAAISTADGQHVATHRTWLGQHGGVWGKAKLREPKKTLGRLGGGTIRLRRGASNKPLREAPAGEWVVIGEGIETCLSVALACPELRVLCGVSQANMAAIELPPHLGRVVLLGDNDAGDAPRRGFARVLEAMLRTGLEVRVARSPAGKDFNDALRGAM